MASVISFDLGTKSIGYAIVEPSLRVAKIGIIDLGTNDSSKAVIAIHQVLTTQESICTALTAGAEIVMESQPAHGAPKVVSHAIQMFCLERHIACRFMAPNEKLRIYPEWYAQFENNTRADRKKLSMHYCKTFLEPQPELKQFYKSNAYKQRTDLADALTQAVRYLQLKKDGPTAALLLALPAKNDRLAKVLAAAVSAEAHPDELATGFKKRAYGETDRPPSKRQMIQFNE